MSVTVDLAYAKESLSELVERAAAGEEIIIAVDGAPRARPIALKEEHAPRQSGSLAGQIWIAEDFDDPLPPEVLRGFYGDDDEGPP